MACSPTDAQRPKATGNYIGVAGDLDLSLEQQAKLRELAEQGSGDAAYRLARYWTFVRNDPRRAKKWLKVAADLGIQDAKEALLNWGK